VLAVILYHLGFSWIPGGLLGVGVFFTLSGYLITDLLLEQVGEGGVKLGSFWLARARRLFPALYVMLLVVVVWVTVIGPKQNTDFPGAVVSAVFYVNNWWLIAHKVSYFEQFAAPQPLNHLWSLSVEEQFYLLWPLAIMLAAHFLRERNPRSGLRPRLALLTLALGVISALVMAALYHPASDPSRIYYGTDTRAQELLIGAVLAMLWPSRRLRGSVTAGARNTIDAIGAIGLLGILYMYWRSTEYSPFLYRGGFLVLSLSTAMLIAALVHPAARISKLVAVRPLRWVGVRSYGIYLWHFPIIVLTGWAAVRGVPLGRAALQVAATLVIAAISWRYLEDPIRKGALARLWRRYVSPEMRRKLTNREMAFIGAAIFLLGVAGIGLAGAATEKKSGGLLATKLSKTIQSKSTAPIANRTVCRSVAHIGDSTSDGLESPEYLPNPRDRISAQYARVGATTAYLDISGARSIVERYENQPNGQEAAESLKAENKTGCWVLALGTNEAANVAAGSNYGYRQRINIMMHTIGDAPVMWVAVKTLVHSGPYAEANAKAWDEALVRACDSYPNMRIYNWPGVVKENWFTTDGIHFTSVGYQHRSHDIADALLAAFPEGQPVNRTNSSNCVVQPKGWEPPPPKAAPPSPTTTTTVPTTPHAAAGN